MKKALLIGINYINSADISLNGCIDDVINMRNMLIDAYDYRASDITILRDDNFTNLPTKQNIIKEIENIVDKSTDLEEFWFHYSGHGTLLPDTKDPENNTDNILVPVDYMNNGYISDVDLFELIKQIQCRSIFIFDCCHSGTICNLPWTFEYQSPTKFTVKKSDIPIGNSNIYVFSGCKDAESSEDIYNVEDTQMVGAFTSSFIQCLRDSHHNIPILNLYRNICIDIQKKGLKQTPVFSSTNPSPSYVITKPTVSAKVNLPIGYANTKTSIMRNMNMMLNR